MTARAFHLLHITDLHIADPSGTEEHLRARHFDEYLGSLANVVVEATGGRLDGIVGTGDFVDKGSVSNFGHVARVVNFLVERFALSPSRVFLCNGNHDVDRTLDQRKATVEARKAYSLFAEKYGNGLARVRRDERAVLCRSDDRLWFLMIDSTLGSGGADRPGSLDAQEADTFIAWIKEIPQEDYLIIGTHHPVHDFTARIAPFDEEDPAWAERHIWHAGAVLRERLLHIRPRRTLWLCGDIHKPVHVVHDNHEFVATGRLGTRTLGANGSQVRRQARVLRVELEKGLSSSLVAEYEPAGHSAEQAQLGQWDLYNREYTVALTMRPRSGVGIRALSDATAMGTSDSARGAAGLASSTELLDEGLEVELLRVLGDARLYRFGRYPVSPDDVALAWIRIGPLLNYHSGLLSAITRQMSRWLLRPSSGRRLLVGIDRWGAVLVSQLSVTTGLPSAFLEVHGVDAAQVPFDGVNEALLQKAAVADEIVLVTDVIASGRTLSVVRRGILDGINADDSTSKKTWVALSMFFDPLQKRTTDMTFLAAHATACMALRLPIIGTRDLPSERVLPSES